MKNLDKYKNKIKAGTKATVLTAGLLSHMMGAVPPVQDTDHRPIYTGDSLDYLSQFLGIQPAFAGSDLVSGDDNGYEGENEGGMGTEIETEIETE